MREQLLDVEVAIPQGELQDAMTTSTFGKNVLAQAIVERVRHEADKVAEAAGGRVRTDRMPEFYVRRGSDVVQGGDFLLVASRWWCEVPENFDPKRAAESYR